MLCQTTAVCRLTVKCCVKQQHSNIQDKCSLNTSLSCCHHLLLLLVVLIDYSLQRLLCTASLSVCVVFKTINIAPVYSLYVTSYTQPNT